MGKLLEWMRGIVLLFFLLTALLYFIPRDVYKKYIRFFMEMVLVLAILLPVMKLFYGEDPFRKMVHYDEFWQELSNLKTDMEHMEYLQNEYYAEQYEQEIGADIKSMADEYGYETKEVQVSLDADYAIGQITLRVKPKEEAKALADFKEALFLFYRTDESHVEILTQ